MRTIIALNNFLGFDFEAKEPPANLYTGEEIDRMDPKRLAGKSREELLRIRQRILDTNNWLEMEDGGDIDSPEWMGGCLSDTWKAGTVYFVPRNTKGD